VRTTTVVIGAGHAGLAASHFLSERAIDHVVLERGEVANSWRTERWDSLRLLTPNWQSRLPGHDYTGQDPDGYMTMGEVVEFIDHFAARIRAPVRTDTTVTSLQRTVGGYRVTTDNGEIVCRTVVIASGACNLPAVPKLAEAVPDAVEQVTPFDYRSPETLPDGGVLVVGASATGVQLAAELRRSGRPVTLSTGEHVRMPRTYRGRDVLWWMDAAGVWDQRYDELPDLTRARRLGSPQLAGTTNRTSLDLNALTDMGVEVVGRASTVRDGEMLFSGGLRNVVSLADLKMDRLLNTFDEWATASGADGDVEPPERFEATRVPQRPRLRLDLLPARLHVAGRARARRQGPPEPRRGRRRQPWVVRTGLARAAPAQVHVHPRRLRRRAGRRRPPRAILGGPRDWVTVICAVTLAPAPGCCGDTTRRPFGNVPGPQQIEIVLHMLRLARAGLLDRLGRHRRPSPNEPSVAR
jgi:putative flavoprotein involved in K+ transport